jgi:hypothetical protein
LCLVQRLRIPPDQAGSGGYHRDVGRVGPIGPTGEGEDDVSRAAKAQQIHPGAYGALVEALAAIYWYKKDLAKFIRVRAREHPELLNGIDFDGYKRVFAEEFVDRLQEGEDRYRDLTLAIMLEVGQLESFPSLSRHEDSERLTAAATTAVATLKTWTARYQGLIDEQEQFAAELAQSRARVEALQGFAAKLAELKGQFEALGAMEDRNKAGRLFEPFLNDLFHLFDLEPRLSYSLESEQIDGSLTFDTDDYIIEAKWWKKAMEREHLDMFDAKVKRKGKNALGLYISVNGFTQGALREYGQRTSFLTMDGGDLICVLEGRMTLDELLRRKKRHANETGNCYYPAYLAAID